jgi:hypothetical protein
METDIIIIEKNTFLYKMKSNMGNEAILQHHNRTATYYPTAEKDIAKALNATSERQHNSTSQGNREVKWQKDVKSLIRDKEMLNIIATYQL